MPLFRYAKLVWICSVVLRLTLAVLPLFAPTSPFGYIHPDEHFQTVEPGTALLPSLCPHAVGGEQIVAQIPWDLQPVFPGPVRSIAAPTLLAALPACTLHAFVSVTESALGVDLGAFVAKRLLTVTAARVSSVAWTVVGELMLARIVALVLSSLFLFQGQRACSVGWLAAAMLGTSWPSIVFGVRPFANTFEAAALPLLSFLALSPLESCPAASRTRTVVRGALLGSAAAVACVIRPSFVLFGPFLAALFLSSCGGGRYYILLAPALAAGATFAALTAVDTAFYSSFTAAALFSSSPSALAPASHEEGLLSAFDSLLWRAGLVSPAVRFLRYNASPAAAVDHGRHWRGTHLFVHLPLLWLPLLAVVSCALTPAKSACATSTNAAPVNAAPANAAPVSAGEESVSDSRATRRSSLRLRRRPVSEPVPAPEPAPALEREREPETLDISRVSSCEPRTGWRSLWLWAALAFIPCFVALSASPHQEPRFLLPLGPVVAALAACLLALRSVSVNAKGVLMGVFAVFNVTLFFFFHFLHQASVVPAAAAIPSLASSALEGNTSSSVSHIVFFSTYPPPLSLSGLRLAQSLPPRPAAAAARALAAASDAGVASARCGVEHGAHDGAAMSVVCVYEARSLSSLAALSLALASPLDEDRHDKSHSSVVVLAPAAALARTGGGIGSLDCTSVAGGAVNGVPELQRFNWSLASDPLGQAQLTFSLLCSPASTFGGFHVSTEDLPQSLQEAHLVAVKLSL